MQSMYATCISLVSYESKCTEKETGILEDKEWQRSKPNAAHQLEPIKDGNSRIFIRFSLKKKGQS